MRPYKGEANSVLRELISGYFGRKKEKHETLPRDSKTAALIDALEEHRVKDPLVGAKVGAKEVFHRLTEAMKDDRGVHIESLLCVLGALAGYACQANIRAQAAAQGLSETGAFHVIRTKDGAQFYFGDILNKTLADSPYSIWSLAAGAARHAGCTELMDLAEAFQYNTSVLGSDRFGIPRLPEGHGASDAPINYLKHLWPTIHPTARLFCPDPAEWPVLYGLAIQEAIFASRETIEPGLALRIVMESAIPMSKVDLASA